jgi:AbrB family looped-hinge helix DNA binding protein
MQTTRLSSRGQLVIPKVFRDAHGWAENTEFLVKESGTGLLLEPVVSEKNKSLTDIVGMLPKPSRKLSLTALCAPVTGYSKD